MTISHTYQPTHVEPPGTLIQEYLETLNISARELARRCGRSAKLMTEIISGKATLEPETALQLERVLAMDASVWLGMEAEYRLHLARLDEIRSLTARASWAKAFPLREIEQRGHMETAKDNVDSVRQLLKFFGAGSVDACQQRFDEMLSVAYRHSPSFQSNKNALLAWLRIGEIKAEKIQCAEFDRTKFIDALKHIRSCTRKSIEHFLPIVTDRCAAAGVAFVVERPLPDVALSGISRWLSPKKALIQQTMRYMSDDHFWFTFFHECAHLLLHSRKSMFIDEKGGGGNAQPEEEAEANAWAANFLIPESELTRFSVRFGFLESEVKAFATEHGVSPGIVVGQLQHRQVLKFNQMNNLKQRYTWAGN